MNFITVCILCVSFLLSGPGLVWSSLEPHPEAPFYNQLNRVTHNAGGGGRFGDQLISYFHAKWVSYRYGIPLLYQPFLYSDLLVLHKEEAIYEHNQSFIPKYVGRAKSPVDFSEHVSNVLYDIPFFPESCWEKRTLKERYPYTFEVDWDDPLFLEEIRRLVQPIETLPRHSLPPDKISVALHVRVGGGWLDGPEPWRYWPVKFPPHSYYIKQLRKIACLFPKQPLFVYIFTDSQTPSAIAQEYYKALEGLDIEFSYREKGNHYEANVLEDFFAMMQYDCLIRPDSYYSIAAEILGSYKLVIGPMDVQRSEEGNTITEVYIKLAPGWQRHGDGCIK